MNVDQDNALTLAAGTSVVLVLAAIGFSIDMAARPARPVGSWARFRWLRVIRREDYVGRHRHA